MKVELRIGLHKEKEAYKEGVRALGHTLVESGADWLITWNLYGQNGKVARRYENVLVTENGYIWSGPEQTYALAKGEHNGAGWWPNGSGRFEKLGVELKPWRTDGDHILICPNRGISSDAMYQPSNWDRMVAESLAHVGRPVRIRPHPGNWKVNPPKKPLEKDLENAWCVVIWSSAAGVRSLAHGIPVIACAPYWICKPATGDLSQIANPPMPDRLPVFERMAWAQWSLDEIRTGEALSHYL